MSTLATLDEISKEHGIDGPVAEALARAAELLGDQGEGLKRHIVGSVEDASDHVRAVCNHLLEVDGKYVRPSICLLAFKAARGEGELPLELAASCELLHSATLLHDDVIDEGEIRRGRPAARVVHGNALSILGGDYLLMRCVEIVSRMGQDFMPPFVEALRMLVEGEVVQLRLRGSVDTTASDYTRIIEGKTASLFAWAALSGAKAAGASPGACDALRRFGWNVGVAFQMVDDILDISADPSSLGKDLLADVREGKMTLPVILAARENGEVRTLLERMLEGKDASKAAARIGSIVRETGAADRVKSMASQKDVTAREALARTSELDDEVVEAMGALSTALVSRER